MTTQEVANQLVSLCREGKHTEAIQALYADGIVSHEAPGVPNGEIKGKEAVLEKSKQWYADLVEVHSGDVSEPLVAGSYFTCTMSMDLTTKSMGRTMMEEVCLYEVKDGKIVSERFFYSMG